MTAEIRRKYMSAGYDTTINLGKNAAFSRMNDCRKRADRNEGDLELEWIAMGAASAYSDICEKERQ